MPMPPATAPRKSSSPSLPTGRYAVNRKPVEGRGVDALAAELVAASGGAHDQTLIVSADAMAAHQSVVNVMDAARRAGLARLTFATQSSAGAAR